MRLRDITPTNANLQVQNEIARFVSKRLGSIQNQIEWLEMLRDAYQFEREKSVGRSKAEFGRAVSSY